MRIENDADRFLALLYFQEKGRPPEEWGMSIKEFVAEILDWDVVRLDRAIAINVEHGFVDPCIIERP